MPDLTLSASSRAQAPATLRPGSDLVLDLAPPHGLAIAPGVALDDHLDADTRAEIDVEAREHYERWHARRSSAVTVERVDLAEVWEVELLARCFMPATRLRRGLPMAIAAADATRLLTCGLDAAMARLVDAIAATLGVAVDHRPAALVREPPAGVAPSRFATAATALGIRPRIQGEVLCVPHWTNYPLIACLMRNRNGISSPVAARVLLPSLGPLRTATAALRGGWLGLPGRRERSASRATIDRALDAAGPAAGLHDLFESAIDGLALEVLRQLAPDTLAYVRHARRALAGRQIRVAMLPFDSPEHARMLLTALRDRDIPSLLVQHGFSARLGDPDMSQADHVAVWSERDRSLAPGRDPATVTVSGNPGAAHLARLAPVPLGSRARRSVVLVDYSGRLSARVDGRVSMTHVATALDGLAAVEPGADVVLRPNPGDPEPSSYAPLVAGHPELRVEIDVRTPIEQLLATAHLCVGALSTATLQACVLGVPTVFLNITGLERSWPFMAGGLPMATDVESLVEVITSTITSSGTDSREAALEALGVRRDAVERVRDLIVDLAR